MKGHTIFAFCVNIDSFFFILKVFLNNHLWHIGNAKKLINA